MNSKGTRLDDAQVGGNHYSRMPITPWQFLESCLTPEEFRGYLKGEAIVYLARELSKAGPVDVKKAAHVLQKLIEVDTAKAASEIAEIKNGMLGSIAAASGRQEMPGSGPSGPVALAPAQGQG